jgi:hypothetical protein
MAKFPTKRILALEPAVATVTPLLLMLRRTIDPLAIVVIEEEGPLLGEVIAKIIAIMIVVAALLGTLTLIDPSATMIEIVLLTLLLLLLVIALLAVTKTAMTAATSATTAVMTTAVHPSTVLDLLSMIDIPEETALLVAMAPLNLNGPSLATALLNAPATTKFTRSS